MASLELPSEAQKQLSMIIQRHAGRARNDYAKVNIMKYSNLNESCEKGENSERNAIKTSAVNALVKETENEMETSDNDSDNYQVDKAYKRILSMNGLRHKRKSESVRHVIESDMEQSENVTKITVPFNRNDLNDKNGQDQKLGKQADEAMSGEQNKVYNKMSGEQNGANDRSSRDASSTVSRKRSKSKLLNLSQPHDNRTFSTFAPPDQERLRHEASHIFEGATFRSFDEFEKYFEAYKIVGNNPYRVASSEVLRDGEGKVIERFKYKYIVYHCAHYGNPRKRAISILPPPGLPTAHIALLCRLLDHWSVC
ncbi:hypothetical protein DINM_001331 [Dirofilaria immitis]|nr:hypothetical protein [Dirofilaria immitis]